MRYTLLIIVLGVFVVVLLNPLTQVNEIKVSGHNSVVLSLLKVLPHKDAYASIITNSVLIPSRSMIYSQGVEIKRTFGSHTLQTLVVLSHKRFARVIDNSGKIKRLREGDRIEKWIIDGIELDRLIIRDVNDGKITVVLLK